MKRKISRHRSKSPKKLRAAVVGAGNMGKNHIRNYFEMPGVDLVAVCDLDKNLLRTTTKQYQVNGYNDVDELLDNEELDLVSMAIPAKFNKPVALKIIDRGIHLLIEKPIAVSIYEGEEIIQRAREKGVVLTVGHIERFNPAIVAVKNMISGNQLGEIVSINARRLGLKPPQFKELNVVLDIGIHDIDVINYLLGRYPKEVWAYGRPVLIKDNEDHADVFLIYDGAVGHIHTNWVTPRKVRTLHITGSNGYVELDYVLQSVTLYSHGYPQDYKNYDELVGISATPPNAKEIKVQKKEPLRAELEDFVRAIRDGGEPLVKPEESLEALKIALIASNDMSRSR